MHVSSGLIIVGSAGIILPQVARGKRVNRSVPVAMS